MSARVWDRGTRGWWIRVYSDGSEEKYRAGPPGEEGEAHAKVIADEINARQRRAELWHSGKNRPLPVADLLLAWKDTQAAKRSERTRATDRARVNRLVRHFGSIDARDILPADCDAFVSGTLKEGRSGHLVAGCLSILRRTLNVAVENRLLDENPLPALGKLISEVETLTESAVPSRDAWSREEAAHIIALARDYNPSLAVALDVVFNCGAPRRGELLALEWESVDFERNRIHWRKTTRLNSRGTKRPKNRRARWAPGPTRLFDVLRAELERQRRAQLKGAPPPKYVVCSPTGLRWAERNFSRCWESLRRKFGDKARPLAFHSTRHSHISWALASGVSPKQLSERVGVSLEVLFSNYAHALPDHNEPTDYLATEPPARKPVAPTPGTGLHQIH